MKFMRYRKPSIRTLAGVTPVVRSVKHDLGISQVEHYSPTRIKQRAKRKLGLYTPPARFVRNAARGKFPTPFGL